MSGPAANDWTDGNELRLLENGEAFYPALIEAIDAAESEVLFETYIWHEDETGVELAECLMRAAGRGVDVKLTVDGFGTPPFSGPLLARMTEAGVSVGSFDLQKPLIFRIRANMLCRLHRKVVVVDGKIGFVGGINVSEQQLRRSGDRSMQDYAAQVTGPVVDRIREILLERPGSTPSRLRRLRGRLAAGRRAGTPRDGNGRARFVTRDNRDHPNDIEAAYRAGIRSARHRIWIACAYFFPGYRLIRDLSRAAESGVEVRLILQGRPDVPISKHAASILYDYLMASQVRIFHYEDRPMHAKVAVIDESWATVGSSNLDPISLGLNLEANLFVHDAPFASALRESLARLMEFSCREVTVNVPRRRLWRRLLLGALYHLTRHMPRWGANVLRRPQTVEAMEP